MNKPAVIVDPLSSGIELAPAFKARGIPTIAVTLHTPEWKGYGSKIRSDDFITILKAQPNLTEILRQHDPLCIIPGTEEGVPLAESLAEALTPEFANDPQKSHHRLHKAFMQQALEEDGIPTLKTLNSADENEIDTWLKEHHLIHTPLIVKPPISAGSDKVFHISETQDWKKAFHRVLTEPCQTTGKISETAIVQEQAIGTEYAVGTVSANGKHYLSHLIQYHKISSGDRKTIFDHVEFIPYNENIHGALWRYTQNALDALGVRWGAAHNEIMLTQKGPRLIEIGARMCGGPVVQFSRAATGCSQADKLVEIFTDGDVSSKAYPFHQTVMPVFLRSPKEGKIYNVESLDNVSKLPTLFKKFIWFKNSDRVPQTVDYLTSIGIIALAGDRESVYRDYQKIRDMESQLIIE